MLDRKVKYLCYQGKQKVGKRTCSSCTNAACNFVIERKKINYYCKQLKVKETMTQEEKDKSVALFDKEVEAFCKETFIKDKDMKGLIFCCARHFADWQKERTINKAYKWLEDNVKYYAYYKDGREGREVDIEVIDNLLPDFKKEMEDKK